MIYCELSENVDRIEVHFPYDKDDILRIKGDPDRGYDGVKGRRWDDKKKCWHVPMSLKSARRLREVYGDRMKLGPALRAWAREEVNLERNLRSLSTATDAKLDRTPQVILDVIAGKAMNFNDLPKHHILRRKRDPRPYQRADIKMMSMSNALNLNDVGTGKTLEVCGATYESGIYPKPILVIAPRRTLVNVWKTEFERLTDYNVLTSEDPGERKQYMHDFVSDYYDSKLRIPHVLALIADDIRVEKYRDIKKDAEMTENPLHAGRDYQGNWYKFKDEWQQSLFTVDFGAFVIDEFHMTGLPNRKTLFHVAAKLIKSDFRWSLSGTPIGGKERRLWPLLNFVDPESYTSEWNWIYEYLEVTKETIYMKGGKGRTREVMNVGGIRDAEKFSRDHQKHMIRRTKRDALPGLPDMVEILVNTPMTKTQERQYREFDRAHEIVVGGKRLSGSIVLTQYLRLRQMANAAVKHEGKRWVNTDDSGKLEHLLERLNENGIVKPNARQGVEFEPGARAYVGVLDKSFCTVVAKFLDKNGIACDELTGDTKDAKPLLKRFADQEGHTQPYVIVMTIQTGGSGLNMDEATSAHLLDDPWDPDQEYQFFGRGHRHTGLKAYTYRTPESIQEYVAEVAWGKKVTNANVLKFARDIEKLRKERR